MASLPLCFALSLVCKNDGWKDYREIERWRDEYMDGWMDGWMDGRIDCYYGRINTYLD